MEGTISIIKKCGFLIFDSQRYGTTVTALLADQADDFSPLCSSGGNCGCVLTSGEFDRRKLLASSVGLLIGALAYDAKDGGFPAASQIAEMPAIRGKDYGIRFIDCKSTKMKYPAYTETHLVFSIRFLSWIQRADWYIIRDMDDWEDEQIATNPAKIELKTNWDDEDVDENDIKDSWEDDDDEPAPPPPVKLATRKAPPKKAASKAAEKKGKAA